MVIGYRAQGTGSYTTLGDDTTGATPPLIVGFVPKMSGLPQVSTLFRGTNVLVAARGNRQWEVKGIIETLHASADAAADFIRTQAAAIPDFLDLQITQGAAVNYLTPAIFVTFEPIIKGVSSTITYGFIGSKYTNTAP